MSIRSIFSLFVAMIIVISSIAVLALQAIPNEIAESASNSNNGQREVTWTISNMFEMYQSDFDYNRSGGVTFEELGRHQSVDEIPRWYDTRIPDYGLRILRSEYPHIFYDDPYSTQTVPDADVGYLIWAPYRLNIDAKNVSDCKSRSGDAVTNTAIYVPDLDSNASRQNDGWINASFYGTYMTNSEMRASRTTTGMYGNHYSRWFFGLPSDTTPPYSQDDGNWFQLMAKVQYSKESAMSYLGWNGTGDVREWFNSSDASLEGLWFDYWMAEGGSGGWADIYTAYDFPEDLRAIALRLDAINSTADSPTVFMWCMSWGMEAQMVRYMEKANISQKGFQNWMEDMYLNVSISPLMSNTTCRATVIYDMVAWEDPNPAVWSGSWMIESQHIDACGNTATHVIYPSPYNLIDPEQWDGITRESRSPWTTHFGGNVSYWHPPLNSSLTEYERIVVKLPTDDVLGINPGKGTYDTLNSMKQYELKSNLYWGRMVLGGWTWPNVTLRSLYNSPQKMMDIRGPMIFSNETQPDHPDILMHGVPMLIFDVQKVSEYDVEYSPSFTSVSVTARNATGAIMTDWNGTVDLFGGPLSEYSHTFSPIDNGTWNTTVPYMPGPMHVYAIDRWFCPQNVEDVVRGFAYFVIPEEPFETTPVAIFDINVTFIPLVIFHFDASNSSDNETPVERLLVRWDLDGDGIWDTAWSTNKSISYHYDVNGTYTVILQVMDERGLTDTYSQIVKSTGEIIPEFDMLAIPVFISIVTLIFASRKSRARKEL